MMFNWKSWLKGRSPKAQTPIRNARQARRTSFRPMIELLEDRLAPATHLVTDLTLNSGLGSLRQAIIDANADATVTADKIVFTTTGGTISVIGTPLDTITHAGVTIDGTTASGLVIIDGTSAGAGAMGLDISGGTATVLGLEITHFNGSGIKLEGKGSNTIGGTGARQGNILSGNNSAGIEIDGAGDGTLLKNLVEGNFIGTNGTGTAILNGGNVLGVLIAKASGNTIGGTSASAANVISGNKSTNVDIGTAFNSVTAFHTDNNVIEGNFIGTNAAGTAAILTTTSEGVLIQVGADTGGSGLGTATGNLIGGTTASARNVISGNVNGVVIFRARGNSVQGDFIGTNAKGDTVIGNTGDGVFIDASLGGGTGNLIGGTGTTGSPPGNVISGNGVSGVDILGDGTGTALSNSVQGNFIGTNAAGTAALANIQGVIIRNASGNTIGGSTAPFGNVISGNSGSNVVIGAKTGMLANNNSVDANLIGTTASGAAALLTGNQTFEGVLVQGGSDHGAQGNTIGGALGNVVSGNVNGVVLFQADKNLVTNNLIGLNGGVNHGTFAVPNTGDGVRLDLANDNIIGSATPGTDNVISGNSGRGIVITGSATTITVSGNLSGGTIDVASTIGFAATGNLTVQLAGGGTTIVAYTGITDTSFTGVTGTGSFAAGGLVAPQTGTPPAQNNLIEGNAIGTNRLGTVTITATGTTNGSTTIALTGVNALTQLAVGMTVTGSGIPANTIITGIIDAGKITVSTSPATQTGVALTFAQPLGNGLEGIYITNGAMNNTIGGDPVANPAAANIIAFNHRAGVLVGIDTTDPVFPVTTTLTATPSLPLGPGTGVLNVTSTAGFASSGTLTVQTTTGTTVLTYAGITLTSFTGVTGGTGTLSTDPGSNLVAQRSGGAIDFSGGSGNLIRGNSITETGGILLTDSGNASALGIQVAPVITNVTPQAVAGATVGTTIHFTLNADPGSNTYQVDFFKNDNNDPEGRTFLGTILVAGGSGGGIIPGVFTKADTSLDISDPQFITATATNISSGNTSQFSNPTPEFADDFTSSTPAASTISTAGVTTGSTTVIVAPNAAFAAATLAAPEQIAILFNTSRNTTGNGFAIFKYTNVTTAPSSTTFTGSYVTPLGTIPANTTVGQTVVQCTTVATASFTVPVPPGSLASFDVLTPAGALFPASNGQIAVADTIGTVELLNYATRNGNTFSTVTLGSAAGLGNHTFNAGALVLGNLSPNWVIPATPQENRAGVIIPTGNPTAFAGQIQVLMSNPTASPQTQTAEAHQFVNGLSLGDVAISADINAHVPSAELPIPAGVQAANTVGIIARVQPTSGAVDGQGHNVSGDFYALMMENKVDTFTDFTIVSILRLSFLPGAFAQSNNFGWTQIAQSIVTVPFSGHVEFDVVNVTGGGVDLTALFNGVVVAHAVDGPGNLINGAFGLSGASARGPLVNNGGVGFFGQANSALFGNFAVRKLVGPPAGIPGSIPYSNDFNNNNNNNNPTELGGSSTSTLTNGGFKLQGDQAVSTTSPAFQFAAAQLYSITTLNPILQADVDVSNPLGTALAAGLFARAQTNGDAYVAYLTNSGLAQIAFFHAAANPVNDTLTVLGSATVGTTVKKGTLQFSVSGSNLVLSLNGSPVVTVLGNTAITQLGQQGIFAWGSGAIIDNFSVSGS